MDNAKERVVLTKEMILKGREKTCFIQVKGFEGELEIRPLTELAWSEVKALTGKETEVSLSAVLDKDGKFDKDATAKNARVKLNMMNVSRNEFEQEVIILKYGLVEVWTEDSRKEHERKVKEITEQLEAGGKPYYQFTQTYEDCIETIKEVHGEAEGENVRTMIESE